MNRRSRTLDICQIAMAAVLIAVCAWITIPTAVPFTMQTFGIFTILQLLGGKKGLIAVLVYLGMGLMGLPVFSGAGAGPAVFLNITGGYLIGFIIMALFYWGINSFCTGKYVKIAGLCIGLVLCYGFGSFWMAGIYGGLDMIKKAFLTGVVPFIIPDMIKLVLSVIVSRVLVKHMRF